MKLRCRELALALCSGLSLALTAYAYANPGVAACALIDTIPTAVRDSDGSTTDARRRIQDAFGTPLAHPVIIFWDHPELLAKLRLNEYASTHLLGTPTCIFIGPKGRSIDVVAHELMHAETSERIGPWARMTQLPTWFDEGLAMQVDYRERYKLPVDADTRFVRTMASSTQFFVENDEELTRRYAAAKSEVAKWMATVGADAVYPLLECLRQGESFASMVRLE